MYKINRKKFFKILLKKYKNKMAYAIANGGRKPSYENMFFFWKEFDVPFEIWHDIKKHIEEENKEQKKAA